MGLWNNITKSAFLHNLGLIFNHAVQVVVMRQGLQLTGRMSAVATRMLKLMKMLIYVGGVHGSLEYHLSH